jgi:hypothetical protein
MMPIEARPLLDRWYAFLGQVQRRVDEILAEARRDSADPAAVLCALHTKCLTLRSRISAAWDRLELELEMLAHGISDSRRRERLYDLAEREADRTRVVIAELERATDLGELLRHAACVRRAAPSSIDEVGR